MGERQPFELESERDGGAAEAEAERIAPPGKRLRAQLLRMSRDLIQRRALARASTAPSEAEVAGAAAGDDEPERRG